MTEIIHLLHRSYKTPIRCCTLYPVLLLSSSWHSVQTFPQRRKWYGNVAIINCLQINLKRCMSERGFVHWGGRLTDILKDTENNMQGSRRIPCLGTCDERVELMCAVLIYDPLQLCKYQCWAAFLTASDGLGFSIIMRDQHWIIHLRALKYAITLQSGSIYHGKEAQHNCKW